MLCRRRSVYLIRNCLSRDAVLFNNSSPIPAALLQRLADLAPKPLTREPNSLERNMRINAMRTRDDWRARRVVELLDVWRARKANEDLA